MPTSPGPGPGPAPSWNNSLQDIQLAGGKRKSLHTDSSPTNSPKKPTKAPRLSRIDVFGGSQPAPSLSPSRPVPDRRATWHFEKRDLPLASQLHASTSSQRLSLAQGVLARKPSSAATRIVRRTKDEKRRRLSVTPPPPERAPFPKHDSHAIRKQVPSKQVAPFKQPSKLESMQQHAREPIANPGQSEVINLVSDDDEDEGGTVSAHPTSTLASSFSVPPLSKGKGKVPTIFTVEPLEISDSSDSLPSPSQSTTFTPPSALSNPTQPASATAKKPIISDINKSIYQTARKRASKVKPRPDTYIQTKLDLKPLLKPDQQERKPDIGLQGERERENGVKLESRSKPQQPQPESDPAHVRERNGIIEIDLSDDEDGPTQSQPFISLSNTHPSSPPPPSLPPSSSPIPTSSTSLPDITFERPNLHDEDLSLPFDDTDIHDDSPHDEEEEDEQVEEDEDDEEAGPPSTAPPSSRSTPIEPSPPHITPRTTTLSTASSPLNNSEDRVQGEAREGGGDEGESPNSPSMLSPVIPTEIPTTLSTELTGLTIGGASNGRGLDHSQDVSADVDEDEDIDMDVDAGMAMNAPEGLDGDSVNNVETAVVDMTDQLQDDLAIAESLPSSLSFDPSVVQPEPLKISYTRTTTPAAAATTPQRTKSPLAVFPTTPTPSRHYRPFPSPSTTNTHTSNTNQIQSTPPLPRLSLIRQLQSTTSKAPTPTSPSPAPGSPAQRQHHPLPHLTDILRSRGSPTVHTASRPLSPLRHAPPSFSSSSPSLGALAPSPLATTTAPNSTLPTPASLATPPPLTPSPSIPSPPGEKVVADPEKVVNAAADLGARVDVALSKAHLYALDEVRSPGKGNQIRSVPSSVTPSSPGSRSPSLHLGTTPTHQVPPLVRSLSPPISTATAPTTTTTTTTTTVDAPSSTSTSISDPSSLFDDGVRVVPSASSLLAELTDVQGEHEFAEYSGSDFELEYWDSPEEEESMVQPTQAPQPVVLPSQTSINTEVVAEIPTVANEKDPIDHPVVEMMGPNEPFTTEVVTVLPTNTPSSPEQESYAPIVRCYEDHQEEPIDQPIENAVSPARLSVSVVATTDPVPLTVENVHANNVIITLPVPPAIPEDLDVDTEDVPMLEAYSSSSRSTTPCRTPGDRHSPEYRRRPEDRGLILSSSKTYGGNPVYTWKDVRQHGENFQQKYYQSKDIPHRLQDDVNRMEAWCRGLPDIRSIFESIILENTAGDEPDAPPVTIVNPIDTEPCPPFEFYYTNQMWHGEGVPPPSSDSLKGCDCYPRCDPKSNKPCSCLAKQREFTSTNRADFAYDTKGRLKEQNWPIFECNELCGCEEDCMNRVVQNGRKVEVRIGKTKNKGWGVFSGSKKIPSGTFIGIYAGELLTDAVAEIRGKKYNKWGRTYLFDVDFWFLRKEDDNAPNGSTTDWDNKYVVDAYHAGNFTRFLNHSCSPNARLNATYINDSNIQKPLLTIFACKEIEPNTEICFSYSGNYDDDDDDETEPTDRKDDAVYETCACGAKNCRGLVFS